MVAHGRRRFLPFRCFDAVSHPTWVGNLVAVSGGDSDTGHMNNRPYVVQFGAGAIGRGFAGQLWSDSGYEVVYVDLDQSMVEALNQRGSYPLRLVDGESVHDRNIEPVSAIDGRDTAAVDEALSTCTFAATAIGGDHFFKLAPRFAAVDRESPLNIILCENRTGAAQLMRDALGDTRAPVGCCAAEVGRMVPVPTSELRAEDPLLVLAEPFVPLIVDRTGWLGPVPDLSGVLFVDDLAPHHARKLYTHNGGHFVLACLGAARGMTYLADAARDPELVEVLTGFWAETGAAMVAHYGIDPDEQRLFEARLLERFRNRALGDTVERVARDPLRKLRPDDRLVGAALLCVEHGIEPVFCREAIAAAAGYAGVSVEDLSLPDGILDTETAS
jgi:mannitol-1-phosphate 5-dehydrogenase